MKITKEKFEGYVYNIEVEDNHNYYANSILVSNCHEDSSVDGVHGDIMNHKFVETLMPYTELAIGGGNPLSHPDLIPFLEKCKKLKIICNLTVNQSHFVSQHEMIVKLLDEKLIYGLGVSVTGDVTDILEDLNKYKNIVLHTICGVMSVENYKKLYDKNLKVLILGYKHFRKGITFYSDTVEKNQRDLFEELPEMIKHFKVVSFDNLAISQLDAKRLMSQEKWNEFYMGDDGKYTMYIDGVNNHYVRSSVSTVRKDLLDNIKDMFIDVRGQ
jgi:MoaA/NifB/PqqE/SkfB family radical SAM enzyme